VPQRILRDGILDSRAVQAVSDAAMLLYYRLISVVDDYGRFDFDPHVIRSRCFSFVSDRWSAERIEECMNELCSVVVPPNRIPLVTAYECESRQYFQINKFGQRTQAKPRFPAPPAASKNGSKPHSGESSPDFEKWWELWSSVRGTARMKPAQDIWPTVVTADKFETCMECTRSYLASLESPNKGFHPDNFLAEQAKENFEPRWPPKSAGKADLSYRPPDRSDVDWNDPANRAAVIGAPKSQRKA
jgi:hypothetical protein